MISHKHKLIFIPIPKNASGSIAFLINGRATDYGHSPATDMMREHEQYWSNYYKFCIIRNPYDRLVSAYHYFKTGWINDSVLKGRFVGQWDLNMYNFLKPFASFQDFILNYLRHEDLSWPSRPLPTGHFYPQFNWIIDSFGKIYNNIDIFEFKDVDKIMQKLTTEYDMPGKASHINKSKRGRYTEYYTDELYEIVYEKYQRDFDLLGFNK